MCDRLYKWCIRSRDVITTNTDDELSKSIHKETETETETEKENNNNELKSQSCFSFFDFCYKEDDIKRAHFNIEYIPESDKKE